MRGGLHTERATPSGVVVALLFTLTAGEAGSVIRTCFLTQAGGAHGVEQVYVALRKCGQISQVA